MLESPRKHHTSTKEESSDSKENEEIQRRIDTVLSYFCEHSFEKFNEGNNGVILKVKITDIPPEMMEDLRSVGYEIDTKMVAKILKISRGQGKQEFQMQQTAYNILLGVNKEGDFAQVPKPYFYRRLELRPGARKVMSGFLNKNVPEKVEMIMMDMVPGNDLARLIYEKIAKQQPYVQSRLNRELTVTPFDELQSLVFQALRLPMPGGKGRTEEERFFEQQKVFNENEEKLLSYLEKMGAYLHPTIVRQLKSSIDLFHQNDLLHRDLHYRNIMIVGDAFIEEGSQNEHQPETFLIDYGTAINKSKANPANPYQDGFGDQATKVYVNDKAILSKISKLAIAPSVRQNMDFQFETELQSNRERFEKFPEYILYAEKVQEVLKHNTADLRSVYYKIVGYGVPAEIKIDLFVTIIAATITDHPEQKDKILRALLTVFQGIRGAPYATNKISLLIKKLQKEKTATNAV